MTTVARGESGAEIAPFDLEKFLTISRPLDLSGIPLEDAAKYPVHESEVRVVRYIQDTELYTVHYMKALMETSALADEEARAFLVNWGYEECYHGRALAKFLELTGHAPSRKSIDEFAKPRRFREIIQDVGGRLASQISKDFTAVHMTWGAINELTACHAYASLADQSANPILAAIVRRIIKDERRHFAFYYQQARRRLGPPFAQKMVKFALQKLWEPVGGTMNPEDRDFVAAYLFDDARGAERLADVDRTIARLPSLEWFGLVTKETTASIERVRRAGVRVGRPQRAAS
jgi:rubrerythrin